MGLNPLDWNFSDYGWKDVAMPHIGAHRLAGDIYSNVAGGSNPIDSLWDTVRGNPQDVKAAYDQAMQTSQQQGDKIRDFLLGRQAQAQQFYAPMQSMFQNMYGSKGIQGPQTPGVPGSQPLGNPQMSTMFGMAQKMGPGGR